MQTESQHKTAQLWLYWVALLLLVTPFLKGLFDPRLQLPVILITLVSALVFWWLRPARGQERVDALDLAVLILAGLYLLATIWAINPRNALQEGLKQVLYVTVYWIASRAAGQRSGQEWLLKALALVTVPVALGSLIFAAGWIEFPAAFEHTRINGPFQYPNTLAAYLLGGLAVLLALRAAEARTFTRLLWTAAGYLNVTVFLFTYSRIAWLLAPAIFGLLLLLSPRGHRVRMLTGMINVLLGMAAAFLPIDRAIQTGETSSIVLWAVAGLAVSLMAEWVTIRLEGRRWFPWALLALGGVAVGAAAVIALPQATLLLRRVVSISLEERSAQMRFFTYYDALRAWWAEGPVLGMGGAGWRSVYLAYRKVTFVSKAVHSSVIETLTEVGLQGAVLLLTTWFLALRHAWRVRASQESAASRLLWSGVMAGALAMLLHSLLDFDLWYPAFTLWVYAAFGLFRSTAPTYAPAGKGRKPRNNLRPVALGVIAVLLVPVLFLTLGAMERAQAAEALQSGQYEAARRHYRRAVTYDPLNDETLINYGDFLIQYGMARKSEADIQEGIRIAQRAIALDAFNADYRIDLAKRFRELNRHEEALALLERAAELDPFTKDTAYMALDEAFLLVTNALLQEDPTTAGAYLDRADVILTRLEKAKEQAHADWAGRELNSGFEDLFRVQYLAFTGKVTEAQELARSLTKDRQVQKQAMFWVAVLGLQEGETEEVQRALKYLEANDKERRDLVPLMVRAVSAAVKSN